MAVVRTPTHNSTMVTILPEEQAPRMTLAAIKEIEESKCEKIILYGSEGWGKTTWAAGAEKPIFLSTEGGLKSVTGVLAFPEAKKWEDLLEAVNTLRVESHEFKTLVVDTADWTEQLCHAYICERDCKDSLIDYGYNHGPHIAFDEWKKLINMLDHLQTEKEMHVIFLAHADVKTFKNPLGEDYDRYQMKMHSYISKLLTEWADCVLFGTYNVSVAVKRNRKGEAVGKAKAYGSDERIIHATHNAAWDAKNRYHISSPIAAPINNSALPFWKIVKENKK